MYVSTHCLMNCTLFRSFNSYLKQVERSKHASTGCTVSTLTWSAVESMEADEPVQTPTIQPVSSNLSNVYSVIRETHDPHKQDHYVTANISEEIL